MEFNFNVLLISRTYPTGIDLVLDPQGGEDCARGISLLAPGGKYVLFGSANIVTGETKSFFTLAKSWWQVEKVSPLKLYEENKTIAGLHLRHLLKSDKKGYIGEKLEKIWKLMAEGKLKPVVDSTLNFKEVHPTLYDCNNILSYYSLTYIRLLLCYYNFTILSYILFPTGHRGNGKATRKKKCWENSSQL